MLEGIRAINLEGIGGNFSRTARTLLVGQMVVHNWLARPSFMVQKEDLLDDCAQRGILHISVLDLVSASLPDSFDLKEVRSLQFKERAVFYQPAKIDSIEIGKGVVIGPRTKIGREVSIGEETLIGVDCRIEHCRIGKQVVIRRFNLLSNVVIGDHTELGSEVVIDNRGLGVFEIGSWVRIEAGTILHGQSVAAGSVVKPR